MYNINEFDYPGKSIHHTTQEVSSGIFHYEKRWICFECFEHLDFSKLTVKPCLGVRLPLF